MRAQTLVVFGEVGAEVEQQVDDLWRTQLQSTDNDWTTNELSMTVLRVADQVTLIHCVHLLLTCNQYTRDWLTCPATQVNHALVCYEVMN